jgi:hypothetical protein
MKKIALPHKLTGRDAANAFVRNTVVGYVGDASPSKQGHENLITMAAAPF